MNKNTSPMSIDKEIYKCLNLDNPKSFFLFAGAGSGKTRSLVKVLKFFRENNINRLRKNNQKVAIITYTNAACDEIKRRLEFDSSFHVSTIHSFAWTLINPYTDDIRSWLRDFLKSEICSLQKKQRKVKNTNTKTYIDRMRKIKSKSKRLEILEEIKKFTYNPNGDNIAQDALNHSEVIKIASDFIQKKSLMQSILVQKYPILLIDESQDTKKELMDAFLKCQNQKSNNFILGMFGDTMQCIYTDGKKNLPDNIPETWAKPVNTINYRCPKRITTLINKIRTEIDSHTQTSNRRDTEGIVRLFIINTTNINNLTDKLKIESDISSKMASITEDQKWHGDQVDDVKILTLEHHMAAKRGGFSNFFKPLYSVNKLKTGLLDGTLPGVSFFKNQILPLIKAKQENDNFEVSKIVRKFSPLIKKKNLKESSNAIEEITKANDAVKSLFALWNGNNHPVMNDILKEVSFSGIFQIPEVLIPIAQRVNSQEVSLETDNDEKDIIIEVWDKVLKCSFDQFERYVHYISDESRFGTHQGIKGLEFPRVMVILDDEDADGFLFSYEKLFGAKTLSQTDIENKEKGIETSVDRTRRLFYVTCSRAKESLAIVAFTKGPHEVKECVLEKGWFSEEEIIQI